jgi:hypothetical protein
MNYEVIPSVAERLMNCPPIAQPIVCQPMSSSYPQNQYIQQPQYPVQYIQQPQYPVQYQMHPNPYDRPMVVMNGTNPIRGMYTSVYTDICSHYGSSTIHPNPADFYQGTRWCNVGILMGNPMYSLEARFRGNALFEVATTIAFLANFGLGSFEITIAHCSKYSLY